MSFSREFITRPAANDSSGAGCECTGVCQEQLLLRPFVEGAVAVGARRLRILARHILPNALTPVIVAAALGVGNAIILEGGLSYLGLGVQAPTPSWGNMIASGGDTLVNAPWVATAPGVALVLVVIACTQLGDALRDVLDPGVRR